MAITANTYVVDDLPLDGNMFYRSLTSEDASGCEEILAASSGHAHYLTKLIIHGDAAIDVSVGSGETTGAITTVHFGLIPLSAEAGLFEWNAPPGKGVKCTDETSITVDASGAGTLRIEAHGKTSSI